MHVQVLRRFTFIVLAVLALTAPGAAQNYPERVVRIVNPYPPGGSVDVMARILAQKLSDNLGHQFIVENSSGGGGNTGSDCVAKSEPDGYTLLFTAPGPLTVNQTLYSKLPFDPAKDFAPIALFATAPIVLMVNPDVPANNVQELIALAKRSRARSISPRPATARPITCPASCSRAWRRSTSSTCPIAAPGRR